MHFICVSGFRDALLA